ncbi:hypothetical protein LCGC14_0305670 [marine sediment metagenome]|uniref:Uncharacterized protein n=1 Tax=marine sediment metagenome TaxID=412755 RepID=A0A0F9WV24_9ZZZZ
MKVKELIFKNAVYWHDYVDADDLKLDLKIQVLDPCKQKGITLKKVRTSDLPQVLKENFDILFFDWGGMSMGNSCLQHFCRYIIKHAEDNPSRVYVMVSTMTSYAMADALDFMNDCGEKPCNVYLSIEEIKC